MQRVTLLFLILLLLLVSISVVAFNPSSSDEATMTITQSPQVYWTGRSTYLYIKYPDGTQQTYRGENIPSSINVPVGTYLLLHMDRGFRGPGVYTAKATAQSLTRLPAGEESRYLYVHADALADDSVGKMVAVAEARIKEFPPTGLAAELVVQICDERVRVAIGVVQQTSTATTSGGFITMTLINPTSTTTSSASETFSELTSSTQTRPPKTSSHALSGSILTITPINLEVTAGDTAWFNISTSLNSPIFEIENLPTGYRYVVTKENGTYFLKIFTHPYSYGRFDMTIKAKSGRVELSQGIRLIVRERTTTQPIQTTHPTSSIETQSSVIPAATESTIETSQVPSSNSSAQTITTVTQAVIRGKEGGYLDIAVIPIALVVALLIAALLLRRRQ